MRIITTFILILATALIASVPGALSQESQKAIATATQSGVTVLHVGFQEVRPLANLDRYGDKPVNNLDRYGNVAGYNISKYSQIPPTFNVSQRGGMTASFNYVTGQYHPTFNVSSRLGAVPSFMPKFPEIKTYDVSKYSGPRNLVNLAGYPASKVPSNIV